MFHRNSKLLALRIGISLTLISGLFGLKPIQPVFASTESFTLILQPDAAAGLDTYIYSGSKNTTYGTATAMGVGEDNNSSNKVARGLIQFDLSSSRQMQPLLQQPSRYGPPPISPTTIVQSGCTA